LSVVTVVADDKSEALTVAVLVAVLQVTVHGVVTEGE